MAAPAHVARSPRTARTGRPVTSALICSQSAERAPPPTTRSSSPPSPRARTDPRCRAARTRSLRAGAREVRAMWLSAEPRERPAHPVVPARRARAGQRRQEQRALASGRASAPAQQLALRRALGAGPPAVLPPETKPGFSTSSMPSTAWAWVSTRRCSSSDQPGRGTATGSAVPVTSTMMPGASGAGAERRAVVVARADDDPATGGEAERVRRLRGAADRSPRAPADRRQLPGSSPAARPARRSQSPARGRRAASRSVGLVLHRLAGQPAGQVSRRPAPASASRGSARAPRRAATSPWARCARHRG